MQTGSWLTDHRVRTLTAGTLPESTGEQEAQHRAAVILRPASAGTGLHPGNIRWIHLDRVGSCRISPDASSQAWQDHLQGSEKNAMKRMLLGQTSSDGEAYFELLPHNALGRVHASETLRRSGRVEKAKEEHVEVVRPE